MPVEDSEKMAKIHKEFKTLPARIHEATDGYYTWNDTMSKHRSLDEETWEVEWLCTKPGMEGIIYGSSYSDENNLLYDWSPLKPNGKPRDGYFYLLEDFGFGEDHPDVVAPVWIPREFDRVVVFDELYMTNYGDQDVWDAVVAMLDSHGLKMSDIKGWACDYHGLTEIKFRKDKGAPIMDKHKEAERYIVWNGIKLVRKLFQTGRLMITDKVVNGRLELMSYKKKKNLDGTYSDVILKKNDHFPDGLRYLIIVLFDAISRNAFQRTSQIKQHVKVHDPIRTGDKPPAPIDQRGGGDKPITAGMMGMKF